MIIEFRSKWPWVRWHRHIHPALPKPVTPVTEHVSWVDAPFGRGRIHHHEATGWAVEYPDGRVVIHPFEFVSNAKD